MSLYQHVILNAPLLLLSLCHADYVFSGSDKFERLSHFKDYGVPGTAHDRVNRAMIADGTCRLFQQRDGYFLWHDTARVERVAAALAAAPSTSKPSYFLLSAEPLLKEVCFVDSDSEFKDTIGSYSASVVIASMQNWYHALCAPAEDPSWSGQFDPAFLPQQMAITLGFMCIVACDTNSLPLEAAALARIASSSSAPQVSRNSLCTSFPWGKSPTFGAAGSLAELAVISRPLLSSPCSCARKHEDRNLV